MAELLTTVKPAKRGRAAFVTAGLFVGTLVLAGQMSKGRASQVLGARIDSEVLRFSFRPPKDFAPGDVVRTRFGPAWPFHLTQPDGSTVELAFFSISKEFGNDPVAVCQELIGERAPFWLRGWGGRKLPASVERLGPLLAVHVADERTHTLVRAARRPEGGVIAAMLTVRGGGWTEETLKLFDRVCHSVRAE